MLLAWCLNFLYGTISAEPKPLPNVQIFLPNVSWCKFWYWSMLKPGWLMTGCLEAFLNKAWSRVCLLQPHISRLATAASLGGQVPLYPQDLSQNFTNQIYQALSGQFSGQLNNQLSGQLSSQISLPNHTNGLGNNPLVNLARAGSAHLQSVGSTHLPATLAQVGLAHICLEMAILHITEVSDVRTSPGHCRWYFQTSIFTSWMFGT